MRILYLHQYFTTPQYVGGSRSYEMARRFAANGHEVTLITSSAFLPDSWTEGGTWSQVEVAGIRVLVLPSNYSNKMSFVKRSIEFARYALRTTMKARAQRADVVFASSTPLTIAIPGVVAARHMKVPLVFEVRDLWPDVPVSIGALTNPALKKAAYMLEKWAYRNAARIVALSPGMASEIERKGVEKDRIHVIPNAADLEVFTVDEKAIASVRRKHPWLLDRRMVLYAGTVGIINGVEYLVRLAQRAQRVNPEIRFVVIGDGNRAHDVRRLAEEAGVLDENFFMLEPIPKRDLATYVAAADVSFSLVTNNPVLWNNSANKFFDAMAARTAVGINYGGWQKTALQEHDAGIVLDPVDLDGACRELLSFLEDENRVTVVGENARRLAEMEFDRNLLAQQLEQVIVSAAKR